MMKQFDARMKRLFLPNLVLIIIFILVFLKNGNPNLDLL